MAGGFGFLRNSAIVFWGEADRLADQDKIGRDWGEDELDAILSDYFAMLQKELAGEHYVKTAHSSALMAKIGRTHRSVEFKHMNISAVLAELGRPTIRGYKPKANYQNAIITAVDRFLVSQPDLVSSLDGKVQMATRGVSEAAMPFEEAPPGPADAPWARKPEMERLVRKFDPGVRDARNRVLGHEGEALVVEIERRRLTSVDRPDLARKVRWVAQEDGDGAGYDILSFSEAGDERLLEVKTTLGTRTTPFLITRNEHDLSQERPDAFRIVRLFEFAKQPRLFRLRPPLDKAALLTPEVFRASFEQRAS
jgi:hypothetical protein